MKFEEALKAMREGNKVKRLNSSTIFALNNGILSRYDELCGYTKIYLLSRLSIEAEDWEIVDE